jgi:hypothetical protein
MLLPDLPVISLHSQINSDHSGKNSKEYLDFPSTWSLPSIPVLINFYLFLHSEYEYNDTLGSTFEWKNGENNLSLLTPWNESISLNSSKPVDIKLLELTIPIEKGSGLFVLSGTVVQNGKSLKSGNNFSDTISVNENRSLKWDMTEETQSLVEIDWIFFDYTYWPPNSGWRIKINESDTEYIFLTERENRFSTKEFYKPLNEIKTDKGLWGELESIIQNYSAQNWGTFIYQSKETFSTDGYSFQNSVKITFQNKTILINERDGDDSKSWIPEGMKLIEEKLRNVIENINTDYSETSFSFGIGSLILGLIVFVILRRKRIR